MNIFYASPSQVNNGFVELLDQEAIHASKVMRAREGDQLVVVDGEGGWYEGPIRRITDDSVQVEIEKAKEVAAPEPELILGMGIIKKRDRLEFAVEKAVELGVSRICLFRSERTIKENVRMDRLESTAISAMKQSLRARLPDITLYHSLDEMLELFQGITTVAAHEKVDEEDKQIRLQEIESDKLLLLIGPEGGFSPREIEKFMEQGSHLFSLGPYRLRTETACVAFLSQFLL